MIKTEEDQLKQLQGEQPPKATGAAVRKPKRGGVISFSGKKPQPYQAHSGISSSEMYGAESGDTASQEIKQYSSI